MTNTITLTDYYYLKTQIDELLRNKASISHTHEDITNDQITNNTINGHEKIVPNSITSSELANNSITTEKISNNAITNEKIAPNSITSSELADNSVHVSEIADKNITQAKLTDTLSNYIDGKIDKKASQILENDDLNDYKTVGFYYSYDKNRTLTLSNIPNDLNSGFSLFVYGSRMSDGVENYVHQLLSVYNKDKPRLLVRTYSSAKQEWGEWIELFTKDSAIINTNNLVDGSISTEKISNYSITNDKISSNAVTNGNIANDSITNGKIKDGNITYNKLNTNLQNTIDGKVNTIAKKINISDNLNDYTSNGFYSCSSSSITKTLVNYPNTNPNSFGLFVMNNSNEGLGNVNQLLATYNNTNQNYFIRSYDSYHQLWSNWNKVITDSKYILREKLNYSDDHTECLVEVYSDDQNVLITFKGQTDLIASSNENLIQFNKTISSDYRPFFKQKTSNMLFTGDTTYLTGIIEEDGSVKLYSPEGVWDPSEICGTLTYPLNRRVSSNIILTGNDGVMNSNTTTLTATLAGNVQNALITLYEEYNLGINLKSNKYTIYNDSTILTAELIDANDKSKIKEENVLIEFYIEE